jgi:CheY-like chemotaxis protein
MHPAMTARLPLPPLFGLSVLIVDDEPARRRAWRTTALRLGLAVECADDGHEALRTLRTHPVDAVLLSRCSARVDGASTLEAIRSLRTRWSGVPVLVLGTAEGEPDIGDRFDAGLAEPLDPAALEDALATLCVRRAEPRRLAAHPFSPSAR